jgi:glutamine phosphoribosylpyrophosphate amidotransferase
MSEADLEALRASGVMVRSDTQTSRFPGQTNTSLTLVSYGGNGQLLVNTPDGLRSLVRSKETGGVVVVSERVELETTSDECITDLP